MRSIKLRVSMLAVAGGLSITATWCFGQPAKKPSTGDVDVLLLRQWAKEHAVVVAQPSNLSVSVESAGSNSVVVAPGAAVQYEVIGILSDDFNEGLALAGFDLDFDGGDLMQADTPTGDPNSGCENPMIHFTIPWGITNPDGYGGTIIGGDLIQVGGAQNTILNTPDIAPFPIGTVLTGVAQPGGCGPAVLVTGTLTAPAVDGTYTLALENLFANVIREGETGAGPFWATEAAGVGAITNLTIEVGCTGSGPENTPGACADTIDNDCDGQTDCTDSDCFGEPVCCGDGVCDAIESECTCAIDCGPCNVCEVHEDAKLTSSDAGPGDRLGWSVSVSGDVAVVGAVFDDCADGLGCGSAYVYRFKGSTWVQEQKLTASDAANGDFLGLSVSVSGDTAVVGAPYHDCGAGVRCGSAYIYRYNGSNWVQEQKLTASDAAQEDLFGYSVSVSGNAAVVGAHIVDCGAGYACGSAYVYRFYPGAPGHWDEEQKLTASDAAVFDFFGGSVSVSGNVAVVGASHDDCAGGLNCGSAYVYRFNGSTWVQEQKLTASDAVADDNFGISVSVSGDSVLVGAPPDFCGAGDFCGSAYIYRFNGSTWEEQAKLIASPAAPNDQFGHSVSVSGDVAVVGAAADDCAAGLYCGSAYVYRLNGSSWTQQAKLTASDAAASDNFGVSVSVSGNTAVVGTIGDDCAGGLNCGSAYVYAVGDCNANGIADECDIAACTGDPACADCNANSIPDGCEPDCNSNAIADECDIRAGGSPDSDANGIPDECEAGACCDGNTGVCADDVPLALCTGDQRSWSVNTLCAQLDPPCTGACCDLLAGVCTDNELSSACSGSHQSWTSGARCNDVVCAAVTGACCDHDPFGGCLDGFTQAECNCGRCEWTKLALCDDVDCAHDSIPTVGAWGLAILTLLLLTGAKVRFGRIQQM